MLYISSPGRLSQLIFGIITSSHTEMVAFREALLLPGLALFGREALTDREIGNIL
jgi:hypothetical protein